MGQHGSGNPGIGNIVAGQAMVLAQAFEQWPFASQSRHLHSGGIQHSAQKCEGDVVWRRLNKHLRVRDQTQKPGRNNGINRQGTAFFTILQCDIQPGQSRAVVWMVQPRCGYQDVDIGCH